MTRGIPYEGVQLKAFVVAVDPIASKYQQKYVCSPGMPLHSEILKNE